MDEPALTPEQFAALTQSEANIGKAFQYVDKLTQLGVDTTDLRGHLTTSINRIQLMKKLFPPIGQQLVQ